MNVSSLMAARDRFVGVQQSPPLAALHHMMETKIPRGPSPPAASLPPTRTSTIHARSYHHHPLSSSAASASSSSTPHRIHNILGRGPAPPSLQLTPDVAAGFAAAAAAAAAGLVVDRGGGGPGVCPAGYSRPPPAAVADCRTPCAPAATTPFWSSQPTVESAVSPVADWNHAVAGMRIIQMNKKSKVRPYMTRQ